MDDPNSDNLYALLETEFGGTVHGWPRPGNGPEAEDRINRALEVADLPAIDDSFRRLFREEIRFGQIYEDAGGFLWRCWCRALKQPNEFLRRYGREYVPSAETAGSLPADLPQI